MPVSSLYHDQCLRGPKIPMSCRSNLLRSTRSFTRLASQCGAVPPALHLCLHPTDSSEKERAQGGQNPHSKSLLASVAGLGITPKGSQPKLRTVHTQAFGTFAGAAAAAAPATETVLTFMPANAALGGLVLGVATVGNLLLTGRVLGISGAVKGLVQNDAQKGWRIAFLAGMLLASLPLASILPQAFDVLPATYTVSRAAVGGLLVGLGASLGNGCTSGHGICGNARLSLRSMVYTMIFMASGMVTATLLDSASALAISPVAAATVMPTQTELLSGLATAALAGTLFTAFGTFGRSACAPSSKQTAAGSSCAGTAAVSGSSEAVMHPPFKTGWPLAASAAVGATFAVGLALSGMTRPTKVVGFLSPLHPAWDLSLMFVMASALAVSFFAFQSVMGKLWATPSCIKSPVLASAYSLPPSSSKIDPRLVVGGVLFGAGWGLSGICPGPGLVALAATAAPQVGAYVAGMVAGMAVEPALTRAVQGGAAGGPAATKA